MHFLRLLLKRLQAASLPPTAEPRTGALFYGGSGYQLGIQVLGCVAVSVWALLNNGILFMTLKRIGWLRVSKEVEEDGLDHSQSVGTGLIGCWPRRGPPSGRGY